MTVTVNPDLMAPLADAGYTLISLHHWDAKAKCPRTGKLRIRGKSPIHRDWTKRPYRNADALEHAGKGGNVGLRLTTRDLVVDVDPRNLDGGQKAMLPALKGLGLDPDYFPTVLTGGGGLHLYMIKPARLSIVDGLHKLLASNLKPLVGRLWHQAQCTRLASLTSGPRCLMTCG